MGTEIKESYQGFGLDRDPSEAPVAAPHAGLRFLCGLALLVGLLGILVGVILLMRAMDGAYTNYELLTTAIELVVVALAMIWSGLIGRLLLDIRDLLAKPPLKQ